MFYKEREPGLSAILPHKVLGYILGFCRYQSVLASKFEFNLGDEDSRVANIGATNRGQQQQRPGLALITDLDTNSAQVWSISILQLKLLYMMIA